MDIHACEVHIDKATDVLVSMAKSDTQYYTKTKKKLTSLCQTLLKDVELILGMLETEALTTDADNEFESNTLDLGSDVATLQQAAIDMNSKLSELVTFVQPAKSPIVVKPTEETNAIDHKNDRFTAEDKKYVLRKYGTMFKQLSDDRLGLPADVVSCGKLLNLWWETRFITNKSGFYYNLKFIPQWVVQIVASYGYSYNQGTLDKYKQLWNDWLTELARGKPNKYALPFEIFNISKGDTSGVLNDFTVDLWDNLIDNVSELTDDDKLKHLGLNLTRFKLVDTFEQSDFERVGVS